MENLAVSLTVRQGLDLLLALPEVQGLRCRLAGVPLFRAAAQMFSVKSTQSLGYPSQRVFGAYHSIAVQLLGLEETGPAYRRPSMMMQSEVHLVVTEKKTGDRFLAVDGGPENGGCFIPITRDYSPISVATPRGQWPVVE